MAAVMQNGLWGYINTKGHIVIETQYVEAHSFRNGIAKVRGGDGLYGFISNTGKNILPCEWEEIDEPKERFVRGKKDGRIYIINHDGNPLFEDLITNCSSVVNGCAVVTKKIKKVFGK